MYLKLTEMPAKLPAVPAEPSSLISSWHKKKFQERLLHLWEWMGLLRRKKENNTERVLEKAL